MYEWIAPSGVKVSSCVPEKPMRWMDYPALHVFWSYWTWGKKVWKGHL